METSDLYPLSLGHVEFVMACAVAGSKTGACVDILARATDDGWCITADGEIVNVAGSNDTEFLAMVAGVERNRAAPVQTADQSRGELRTKGRGTPDGDHLRASGGRGRPSACSSGGGSKGRNWSAQGGS